MEIVRTVGKGLNNNIVINKPSISDAHAEITFASGNKMIVEDLDSKSGTFVNNQRITGRYVLTPGDILCFGDHVFPFEEHYPEMLKSIQVHEQTIDDTAEIEEPIVLENDEQIEVMRSMSGLKRWLYLLQFPKDRQQMQQIWILIIGGVMLVSMVVPFVSWSYPYSGTFIVSKELSSMSGIEMFMDLTDVTVTGKPLLYIMLFGLTLFMILGMFSLIIMLILFGTKVWKPLNLLAIRRVSQIMLVLFGLNFFLQFLRFLWFWLDGENAMVQTSLLENNLNESHIYIENMGIGYWLCGICVILVLRSTRNGLWKPQFGRKWLTLSFSFWIPFVMMIGFVHQGLGVVQTTVDVERYEDVFSDVSKQYFDIGEMEIRSRTCQGAPALSNTAYQYLIREYKIDASNKARSRFYVKNENHNEERFYITAIWLMLHCLFIILIVMMLRSNIKGITQFVLSGSVLLFSLVLFISLYKLIGMRPDAGGDIIKVKVGIGAYIAILGGLGLVGEQFYFWTNRTERSKEQKLLDELD